MYTYGTKEGSKIMFFHKWWGDTNIVWRKKMYHFIIVEYAYLVYLFVLFAIAEMIHDVVYVPVVQLGLNFLS